MTEAQAKAQLRRMLRSLSPGSVLHLLADIHRQAAGRARRKGNDVAYRRFADAQAALFVFGLGLDAVCPR
jgi:hypothetical protein